MADKTIINPYMIDQSGIATSLNPQVQPPGQLAAGTVICGKYSVLKKLSDTSGEADLYLCTLKEQQYVAKIYHRTMLGREDIFAKLKQLQSPYIASIYETGNYLEYFVEILPYYQNGSLQGRTYGLAELKEMIIPCLNEGLKTLHDNGIIHKDLKPANIMLNDSRKDIAIIDFGISSLREDGNTVVVTQTGMTPEYSAPETFKNLFLNEADYYSMGITLYELFCGKTPYTNLSQEDIERYVSVQRIPFPQEMPKELQELIRGLTYYDITNRRNKKNPNRRWGYEEVKKWLAGIHQTIPGEGTGSSKVSAYEFMGESYKDRPALVRALAENWEAGKKQLFRGHLANYFRAFDQAAEQICQQAEGEATRLSGKDNRIFCQTLYRLQPETFDFMWKGKVYASLPALGRELLDALWNQEKAMSSYMGGILSEGILSFYIGIKEPQNEIIRTAVKGLETRYRAFPQPRDRKVTLYLAAYMLSGQKLMHINETDFRTIGEVASHMRHLAEASFDDFTEFCHNLIDYSGNLEPQFESWLMTLGKEADIGQWRHNMLASFDTNS